MRRACLLVLGVVAVGGVARADDLAVESDGDADPAAPILRLDAGAGAIGGAAVSTVAVGAAIERPWLILALTARARTVGDRFAREDWDDPRDLASIVRTVVVHNRAARDRAALIPTGDVGVEVAAGALARIEVGTGALVAGAVPAIDAGAHPGVHARLAGPRWAAELAIDDVLAPRLLAAAGRAPVGDAWLVTGGVAIDPSVPAVSAAPMTDVVGTRVLAAASAGLARPIVGPTWSAAGYADAAGITGAGAGLHVGARAAVRTGEAIVHGRLEATAGTAGWTPAPFGPLHRVVATELRDRADHERLGGVGGAAQLAVTAAALHVAAGARHRPGLGTELDGELALAAGPVELAAWTAAATAPVARLALVGEARVHLARHLRAGLEAGRLYRRDLGLDGARASWHALAWFGGDLAR